MTLFTSDQFIIIPTLGFVRDRNMICLTIAWLMFGLSLPLFEIKRNET